VAERPDTASAAEDILEIEGSTNLLLVAPHGHRKDDENTDGLTLRMARHLGCHAIVNPVYRKPRGGQAPDPVKKRLDLNKVDQAGLHPSFLNSIRAAISGPGKTVVVWVHGIRDENIRAEALRSAYRGNPDALAVLIGYGQGRSNKTNMPQSRFTAEPRTVARLVASLDENGLNALPTDLNSRNYRGRHEDYMNQWFVQNGFPLAAVESIQLELKFTGVRAADSQDAAAKALAKALAVLL